MKHLTITLFTSIVLILTGCASVPMASVEADAQAKQFVPSDGKSKIYVYRNENFGAALKMTVLLDDKILADTAAKTYVVAEVEPGQHILVSKTENDAMLELDTKAGEIYYVWQEVKMGAFTARSKLHLVDQKAGQEGVNESKLILK